MTGRDTATSCGRLFCGGDTRAESVLNGLMAAELEPGDWVLVHDAARPCLRPGATGATDRRMRGDAVGGILAVPVADTLKRADADGRIARTESRERLWQAQTPQMFRTGLLTAGVAATRQIHRRGIGDRGAGIAPQAGLERTDQSQGDLSAGSADRGAVVGKGELVVGGS